MIGIYVRLSQEDEENNSIGNQLREGKAFAGNQSYEIYNEGQGISGRAAIKDRPELDRLMKDIAIRKITTVWFRNQNRLERNSETFAAFSTLAKRKKLKVFFGDKEIDWKDPNNSLQSKIMSALNEYQAELQSHQTTKTLLQNAKDGKAFGITPYGYKTDDKGYFQINDDEAKEVKRIYALSLDGIGTRAIAEVLNEEGIPTRYNTIKEGNITVKNKQSGKVTIKKKTAVKWAGNTVRGIITNSIYKGERVWNRENSQRNKERREEGIEVEPEKVIKLQNLEIVPPHYWQKVNDNLSKNSNNKGKSVDHKYLLKGLLECGDCGSNYYGRTRTNKKDNYYMCSSRRYKKSTCKNRSFNIDILEDFIWVSMFEGSTLYIKMLKTINKGGTKIRRDELKKLIISNETKLQELANEWKNVRRQGSKGILTDAEMEEDRKRITRAENDLKERLKKDREEQYLLENENMVLNDIRKDFNYNMNDPAQVAMKEVNDLFKKFGEMYPEAIKKYDERIKKSLVNEKKERIMVTAAFNEKQKLLKKYIKRIIIHFDYINRIYNLKIAYNLPMEDEKYLIDSNYIAAYSLNNNEMVNWNYDYGRNFTEKKVNETLQSMENYSIV